MASITPISPNIVQTCPHGLPAGACPVCSGMGGGGSAKKADPAPKNEMSYAECYAIWMRMKADDRRKLEAENNLQRQAQFLQNSKQMLANMAERLLSILNKMETILPKPVAAVFNAAVNSILKPIMTIIQNFPDFVNNINKFIQKQVSETFKKFTKKVYKILNIFGLRSDDDFEEDEKVSAEIAAFKAKDVVSIKEFLISLIRTERKPKDDNNNNRKAK